MILKRALSAGQLRPSNPFFSDIHEQKSLDEGVSHEQWAAMVPEDREASEIQSLPETKDLCADANVSQGFLNLWISPDLELVIFFY